MLDVTYKNRMFAIVPGQTCVHLAASAGRVELLQMLVFYGADINARVSNNNLTSLIDIICLSQVTCLYFGK